jgi:hypothetical protein
MAKKYYPTLLDQIHEANIYMARYNSVILAALAVANPGSVVTYEALREAVAAFDALRSALVPVLPDGILD